LFSFVRNKMMDNPPCLMPGMRAPGSGCDSSAPKIITSKTIVEFQTSFFCHTWFLPEPFEPISITVRRQAQGGCFTLKSGRHNVEVTECFLAKIQEVIDKNKLVECNGCFERIYGVPPEAEPYTMKAVYDSGEKLSFAICTSPSEPWCQEIRALLCEELVRHGIKDMLPPEEDRRIVRFDLEFDEWPLNTQYCTMETEDDEEGKRPVHYSKCVWNRETNQGRDETYTIPDGFYDRISELVEQTGLRNYCNGRIDFPSDVKSVDKERTAFIRFCAEGESGRQFNAHVYGEEISQGLLKATGIIRDHLEQELSKLEPEVDEILPDSNEDEDGSN